MTRYVNREQELYDECVLPERFTTNATLDDNYCITCNLKIQSPSQ